jgi:hypothetical protein
VTVHVLKYWQILFKLCLEILAQKLDCSHKLYFGVQANNNRTIVISRFRRDAGEICALMGYYAASSDVGKELPLNAALYPRRVQISIIAHILYRRHENQQSARYRVFTKNHLLAIR